MSGAAPRAAGRARALLGALRRRARDRLGRGPGPLVVRPPEAVLEVFRDGPAPLAPLPADRPADAPLRVAFVVPSFRRGSGGHSTLAHLVRGLEARGHECSLWLEDDQGRHTGTPEAEVDAQFKAWFGPLRAPLRTSLERWDGADVAVATGWQTVHRVLRLPGAAARAYLVQDHEPEFFATSAERIWAEDGYRRGLHCVCASPWLAALVRERYGAAATSFDLGVDHDAYTAVGPEARRDDLVVFYARPVTPRRAVPLGVLALTELHRRRPGVEIVMFGEARALDTGLPHRDAGVLPSDALAALYRRATVGLVLSLTNPSLVPTEMLACGLPCVDLASDSMLGTFGAEGPIALAPPDPVKLADAVERLLDDPAERERRARAGLELVAARTWERASAQLEDGLREALSRERPGGPSAAR